MINVQISPGELIDKITILLLKKKYIKETDQQKNICYELSILEPLLIENDLKSPEINELSKKLHKINSKLWKIEDNLRDMEKHSDFDKNFIELARSVYYTNDQRAEIKKQINIISGSKIIEEKSYNEY